MQDAVYNNEYANKNLFMLLCYFLSLNLWGHESGYRMSLLSLSMALCYLYGISITLSDEVYL